MYRSRSSSQIPLWNLCPSYEWGIFKAICLAGQERNYWWNLWLDLKREPWLEIQGWFWNLILPITYRDCYWNLEVAHLFEKVVSGPLERSQKIKSPNMALGTDFRSPNKVLKHPFLPPLFSPCSASTSSSTSSSSDVSSSTSSLFVCGHLLTSSSSALQVVEGWPSDSRPRRHWRTFCQRERGGKELCRVKRELLQPEPSIQGAAWGSKEVGAGAVGLSVSPLLDLVLVTMVLCMCGWVVLSCCIPNNLYLFLHGFLTCLWLSAPFFWGLPGLKRIRHIFFRRTRSLGSPHPSWVKVDAVLLSDEEVAPEGNEWISPWSRFERGCAGKEVYAPTFWEVVQQVGAGDSLQPYWLSLQRRRIVASCIIDMM